MELDRKFVGTAIKAYKTRVTWRQTTNFAAAIQDANACYLNDECEGGLVSHPLFPVAVNWPIIENISEYIVDKDFPQEVFSTGVHYTEHLILHRLIKPKDRLTINGQIAAILPHRAGCHFIGEFTATDKKGKPVFTEYSGMMLRGVKCTKLETPLSSDLSIPEIPRLVSESWQNEPKEIWTKFIEPYLPYVYDGCTNIVFPIHTSQKFAHEMNLPGIILQGTATLAIAVSILLDNLAGGNPSIVKEIYCQFTGMVLPGTEIKIQLFKQLEIKGDQLLYFNVLNEKGKKAISNGFVRLKNLESPEI